MAARGIERGYLPRLRCKEMFAKICLHATAGRAPRSPCAPRVAHPIRSGSAGCGGRPAHRVGGGASDRRELGQRVVPPATARPLRARRGGAERGRAGAPSAATALSTSWPNVADTEELAEAAQAFERFVLARYLARLEWWLDQRRTEPVEWQGGGGVVRRHPAVPDGRRARRSATRCRRSQSPISTGSLDPCRAPRGRPASQAPPDRVPRRRGDGRSLVAEPSWSPRRPAAAGGERGLPQLLGSAYRVAPRGSDLAVSRSRSSRCWRSTRAPRRWLPGLLSRSRRTFFSLLHAGAWVDRLWASGGER